MRIKNDLTITIEKLDYEAYQIGRMYVYLDALKNKWFVLEHRDVLQTFNSKGKALEFAIERAFSKIER